MEEEDADDDDDVKPTKVYEFAWQKDDDDNGKNAQWTLGSFKRYGWVTWDKLTVGESYIQYSVFFVLSLLWNTVRGAS